MAKQKAKAAKGVPSKHLHARVSFLQQAAFYLATRDGLQATDAGQSALAAVQCDMKTSVAAQPHQLRADNTASVRKEHVQAMAGFQASGSGGLPLYMSSQLRQIAQKSQIRLHPSIKHGICRTCNSVLVEGRTVGRHVENRSYGGKKPHADILVLECRACGASKRFPVGSTRQQSKANRMATGKCTQPPEAAASQRGYPGSSAVD